jgi:hypothetical protein
MPVLAAWNWRTMLVYPRLTGSVHDYILLSAAAYFIQLLDTVIMSSERGD